MAIKLNKLAAAISLVCVLPMASATVLSFDDLSGTNFFTSTYKGFNFGDNSPATNPWFYSDQASPFYTPKSGTHFVATDFTLYDSTNPAQATQAITSATAFKFDGAWFSGGDQIQYQLYSGSSLVYTSTPSATLTSTPMFVASGYTPLVTGVVVIGRQGFYGMDDFTYNTVAAVPEPSTYALLAAGLLAVGYVARRRQQRQG